MNLDISNLRTYLGIGIPVALLLGFAVLIYALFGIVATLVLVGSYVLGVGLLPLVIYAGMLPKGLRQPVARIHLWLEQFAFKRAMALVWRSDGRYSLVPMEVDGTDIRVKFGGRWHDVNKRNALHRFAGGWFCELVERGEQLEPYIREEPPEATDTIMAKSEAAIPGEGREDDVVTVRPESGGSSEQAVADGGDGVRLPGKKVWYKAVDVRDEVLYHYNPFPDPDGFLADLGVLANELKGQNKAEPAMAGMQEGLDEGGGDSGPGPLFWFIASALAWVFAIGAGVFVGLM